MRWAVVLVDVDYDYVCGVKCIATYQTEEAATKHIRLRKEFTQKNNLIRHNYIKGYVNKIDVPERISHADWMTFLSHYPVFKGRESFVSPSTFHEKLFHYLDMYLVVPPAGMPDYNPPEYYPNEELFPMEIAC